MWNDTDTPLAYLITFRCYGTWLHGDERGSTDRFHNQYQSPFIQYNETRRNHNLEKLKNEVVTLAPTQREYVEIAVRETCNFRGWLMYAINVRTNHVHIVVSIGNAKPEHALSNFKAYSTKKLRQNNCWNYDYSPWSDKGSKRYLWNESSVVKAVDYVVDGQGDKLPDFD